MCNVRVTLGMVLLLSTAIIVFLHEWLRFTYLWEHTALSDAVRSHRRRTCTVPTYMPGSNVSAPLAGKDLRIGLLMMYDQTDNLTKAWSTDLLQPLIRNREQYCKRHGYELLDVNHLLDTSRGASWSKLLALEHHFKAGFDYLLYMDMDVIIMNPEVSLERFIDASRRSFDVLLTEDDNGMNAGVFLMRNSEWSLWFLRTAWEQTQLVPATNPQGKPYPFRWEQRAFHYMTHSKVWQQSGLAAYPGDYMDVRKHFFSLPQCAFNSYILHPFDLSDRWDDARYAPGDFLIHFAGKRGDSKQQLMTYFMQQLTRLEDAEGRREEAAIRVPAGAAKLLRH
ncbi:hypothetical protein B484DRAFT_445144 [Ochromonadaceae sp. CCMP2298]|nr:hypothetical protein B484DRAFT_445144 [Ochromonadaceae sp. CCMP2298]|mmetsp:Transcript_31787/g.70030  ORF Transcript_31787/g.70030 Transcript_31787/m.70030 type:complete len:337 (+) Transcript_31787:87-1097(+)